VNQYYDLNILTTTPIANAAIPNIINAPASPDNKPVAVSIPPPANPLPNSTNFVLHDIIPKIKI
jgi:hypothetical protein